MTVKKLIAAAVTLLAAALFAAEARAEDSSTEELAKKLQNPVAPIINVPIQNNYNWNVGQEHDGNVYMLRVQPVIPLPFNREYAVVSRTVLPFMSQDKVLGASSQTGLGDTEQSFFFTPMKPSSDGLKWGAGPLFYLPTATNPELGAEKWGLGPTGVILTQNGPWTAGLLANHIWSVAGHKDRPELNQTYLKPFGAYTFHNGFSINATLESDYDWRKAEWSLPFVAGASKVLSLGTHRLSVGGMLTYDPEMLASNKLGLRAVVTLLLPVHVKEN